MERFRSICTIKNARLSALQTQNDFMREFLDARDGLLAWMMDCEARAADATCSLCSEPGIWRCLDCLGRPLYCRQHCRDSHTKHICHRIQKWTGQYFLDCQMWEVGVKLYLGHRGAACPHFEGTNLDLEGDLDRRPDVAPHISYAEQTTYMDGGPDADADAHTAEDVPSGPIPFLRPVPSSDGNGNPFLLIIDCRQGFHIPVVSCGCGVTDVKAQYMELEMFPASYENVQTVFTFRCLDDFRVSNLECKTSAYQYFQKIRRLTNPAFPQAVPNRYMELLRLSRQWRNLKLRKWFQFAHRPGAVPKEGEMALFCAACPQVDLNLPEDWEKRYTV